MRTSGISFLFISVLAMALACKAQSDKPVSKTAAGNTDAVEVYYFHFTRRCVTCQAVEAQTKLVLRELYGDKIDFSAFNLENTDGATKGKELGVSGQTLLIVKGGTKIDLTGEGFMYARTEPEKFRQIIKEKIDPLL